jgi:hypothetical protein
VLFAAASWAEVQDVVGGFFDGADDDLVGRLAVGAAHPVG